MASWWVFWSFLVWETVDVSLGPHKVELFAEGSTAPNGSKRNSPLSDFGSPGPNWNRPSWRLAWLAEACQVNCVGTGASLLGRSKPKSVTMALDLVRHLRCREGEV